MLVVGVSAKINTIRLLGGEGTRATLFWDHGRRRLFIHGRLGGVAWSRGLDNDIEHDLRYNEDGWVRHIRISCYFTENQKGNTMWRVGIDAPPSVKIEVVK